MAMLERLPSAFLPAFLLALAACSDEDLPAPPAEEVVPHFDYPKDDVLRLHHVQTKATHNSYHVANPDLSDPEYKVTHAPLDVELGQGVRGFEIDVNYNADTNEFRVYHIVLLDEGTTCATLVDCLRVLKTWSDAHRAHHPLTIQIEIKDAAPAQKEIEPYFDSLHAAILGVWPRSRIITPDDVQGAYPTLGEAVKTEGWPTLGGLRGRVLFMLYNLEDGFGKAYSHDESSLAGRLAFTRALPNDPLAALTLYDNAINSADDITNALSANMLVRTRSETTAANPTDAQRDATLAIGATLVATDFPSAPADGGYWVDIPGGTPSRCNPKTAPAECTSLAIEDPKFVGP